MVLPFHRWSPRLALLISLLFLLDFVHRAKTDDEAVPRPTTFVFNRFNGTDRLTLLGVATELRSESVLMLTNHSHFLMGRAFYSAPVQMKPHGINSTVSSFSTTFVFSMLPPPSDAGGHGITFLMSPSPTLSGALSAEYIGLLNFTSNGQDYNHLFAVEFDTSKNVEFLDPDDNHVGIDINNLQSVEAKFASYWDGKGFRALSLKSGRNIQAWIEYDHLKGKLYVSIIFAGLPKPQRPLISLDMDLSTIVEEEMYVGFSAATGNFVEDHYVMAWSFSTNGTAPPLDVSVLPSFANDDSSHLSNGFIAGVTAASAVLVFVTATGIVMWVRRTKEKEETVEDWELEYWPHRFPYEDLSVATNGFSEDQVLGHGGFGRVYHGVLPNSGVPVAVKCITREFGEGMKGFIAEITSMGRLQHRNLVQLRGWCRRQKQLFIVYDYMPNGSLDKLIFGNPTAVLRWCERYNILKGVAAGLLYLHEQWEKRVVHRDIKSSNVLLDSELNGRLGDFGLAKLYDHSENPQTTHVVGTLGYIAPELIHTGKATPSSDVFSFGALLLEVACGRRPVDPSNDAEQVVLVEWVWGLYTRESLLDAADPKLQGDYGVEEMERVLKLGLLCSHPAAERRPGIRLAWQILEVEAPLPPLDIASFSPAVMTPRGFFSSNGRASFCGSGSKSRHTSGLDNSFCSADSCSQSLTSGR
ncbi:L-type lectin-domain containing receptor kinase SIT2 [Cryptomeria japonica]|uniref:L-type lectin-domain containing receptor kinase SIT2 n=1 Tax=Cryptomeria japonica TaxID=3369 RepID=UPI0027DA0FDD|nr:L-type lectin-domain containing receptor kinase SIT2 [Cryptomeria japonica]